MGSLFSKGQQDLQSITQPAPLPTAWKAQKQFDKSEFTWNVNAPDFVPNFLKIKSEEAADARPTILPTSPPLWMLQTSHADEELARTLRPYVLSSKQMRLMGYPVEVGSNSLAVLVYIHPKPLAKPLAATTWNVNAPEFVPNSQGDRKRGVFVSTRPSDNGAEAYTTEHVCARCNATFVITHDGKYLHLDKCIYHWGRMYGGRYSCCKSSSGTRGCSWAWYHVWSGTYPGINGPLEGYVRAHSSRGGVYAVDTEMIYTTSGLELASVAVVAADGRLVYKSLVKPSSPIVDLNTRFSGISPGDIMCATKTLQDVQEDILQFVGTDTILIGHALENDLRALKLLHGAVVDTCALYPHSKGFPMRRSLRTLSEEFLGRKVQGSSAGHSPVEDARAAIDLVLLKVRKHEFGT